MKKQGLASQPTPVEILTYIHFTKKKCLIYVAAMHPCTERGVCCGSVRRC